VPKKLVVFINAPSSDWLQASQSNMPEFVQPILGILTLASAVKQVDNIQPVYLDGTVCPFSVILDFISSHKHDIIAICLSALTSNYIAGLRIFEHARKENPRIVHIVGNDHFTALSTLCMQNQPDLIDCGIVGDAVVGGLGAIIAQIEREGCCKPVSVPGLVFREGTQVVHIPQKPEPLFTNIDYDLIDQVFDHSAHYAKSDEKVHQSRTKARVVSNAPRSLNVEVARGCIKFKDDDACSFCSIQHGGMWKNEVRNGVEAWEIIRCAYQAGYQDLYFTADELPLTFPKLLLDMKANLPAWFTNLPLQDRPILEGYARADGLAVEKNARLLYDLGFRFIWVGVEAGSIQSLKALNKPLRENSAVHLSRLYQANRQALRQAHTIGLKVEVGYVLGHLGMTRELLSETVELFRSLVIEHHETIACVDVNVLIPEPGSTDYACLLDPNLAEKKAVELGLEIASRPVRQEIAETWKRQDEMLFDIANDYVRAFMPDLTMADLVQAQNQIAQICRANDIRFLLDAN
jgi:radical SAM superfamily enzyme YgiQ (UPF0313 family)